MSQQSFRLNKSHRADICNAILANWEKQNPKPKISQQHLDRLIVDLVLAYDLQPDVKKLNDVYNYALSQGVGRLHNNSLGYSIKNELKIRVMNPQGEERTIIALPILVETLERLSLTQFVPTRGLVSKISIADSGQPILGYHVNDDHKYYPEQDKQAVIDKLPAGIQGEIQKAIEDLEVNGCYNRVSAEIVVAGFHSCANPVEVVSNHPYFQEETEVRRKFNIWSKERNQLRKEVMDTLEQFNTSKQLKEGWPEVEGYLPPHMADMSVINLPAISINRLNERLALNP